MQRHAAPVAAVLAAIAVISLLIAFGGFDSPDAGGGPQKSASPVPTPSRYPKLATCDELTEDLGKLFVTDLTMNDAGTELDDGERSVVCDVHGDFRFDRELTISVRIVLFRLERPSENGVLRDEWARKKSQGLLGDCDGGLVGRRVPAEYAKACDTHEEPSDVRFTVTVSDRDAVAYVWARGSKVSAPVSTEVRSAFESMAWVTARATLATA